MTAWFRSPCGTGRAMVVAVSTEEPECCESVRQMVRDEPLRPRRLFCQEPELLHRQAAPKGPPAQRVRMRRRESWKLLTQKEPVCLPRVILTV